MFLHFLICEISVDVPSLKKSTQKLKGILLWVLRSVIKATVIAEKSVDRSHRSLTQNKILKKRSF